ETTKLESDQAVDTATANLRQARVALAFFLGFRGHAPDFDVERERLNFTVPDRLQAPSEAALMREAVDHRPDLKALGFQRDRAEASIDLEKRKRFPDIA